MEKYIKNLLLESIKRGSVNISLTIKSTRSMDIVPMAKSAGFNSIFIDGEHACLTTDTINDLCITALGYNVTPIVRVASGNAAFITKVLDAVHSKTAKDVKEVVKASKFWPLGERSANGIFPQFLFDKVNQVDAFDKLNKETLTIPMVETLESLENLDEILQVKGVDAILVGSSDLSCVLGVMNQYDHPIYIRAVEKIIKAARKAEVPVGIGGLQNFPHVIRRYQDQGVTWFLGSQDNSCLSASLRAGGEQLLLATKLN